MKQIVIMYSRMYPQNRKHIEHSTRVYDAFDPGGGGCKTMGRQDAGGGENTQTWRGTTGMGQHGGYNTEH